METARQTPPGARPNRNGVGARAPGPSGPAVRVGCLMRRATGVPEEWPSRPRVRPRAIQNPAYRPADAATGRPAENLPGAPPLSAPVGSRRNAWLIADLVRSLINANSSRVPFSYDRTPRSGRSDTPASIAALAAQRRAARLDPRRRGEFACVHAAGCRCG